MKGKFGVWDATLVLEPNELKQLIKMAMKASVIWLVLKLIFLRGRKKQ